MSMKEDDSLKQELNSIQTKLETQNKNDENSEDTVEMLKSVLLRSFIQTSAKRKKVKNYIKLSITNLVLCLVFLFVLIWKIVFIYNKEKCIMTDLKCLEVKSYEILFCITILILSIFVLPLSIWAIILSIKSIQFRKNKKYQTAIKKGKKSFNLNKIIIYSFVLITLTYLAVHFFYLAKNIF